MVTIPSSSVRRCAYLGDRETIRKPPYHHGVARYINVQQPFRCGSKIAVIHDDGILYTGPFGSLDGDGAQHVGFYTHATMLLVMSAMTTTPQRKMKRSRKISNISGDKANIEKHRENISLMEVDRGDSSTSVYYILAKYYLVVIVMTIGSCISCSFMDVSRVCLNTSQESWIVCRQLRTGQTLSLLSIFLFDSTTKSVTKLYFIDFNRVATTKATWQRQHQHPTTWMRSSQTSV